MSMVENKNSEAGFREQFELEYQRKQKEEEERKRPESLLKHKKNMEPLGNDSKELREYVRAQFDKQRQLTNCKGQKTFCLPKGSHLIRCYANNHVIS